MWVTVLMAWANITKAQDADPANTSLIRSSLDLEVIHNFSSMDLEALGNSTGTDSHPSNDYYPSFDGGSPDEYLNDYNSDYYYDEQSPRHQCYISVILASQMSL